MSEELDACKHCGGDAALQHHNGQYSVWCDKCHISTAWGCYRAAIIAEWNRRATPAPASEPPVKDHVLREVVNSLRDIAIKFHAAGQLRERLRGALDPLLSVANLPSGARDMIRQVQQIGFASAWCDVSQFEFDRCDTEKRIVYAALPEAPETTQQSAPKGWKLVPIEPTEDMAIAGFESPPDPVFDGDNYPHEYDEMSGCQQAAFMARRCYAAMLAAAPDGSQ